MAAAGCVAARATRTHERQRTTLFFFPPPLRPLTIPFFSSAIRKHETHAHTHTHTRARYGSASIAAGQGPYLYLPKMESHLEARLWNHAFNAAQV